MSVTVWTIYWRPRDVPGAEYVVRGFNVVAGEAVPHSEHVEAPTLDAARRALPPAADACLGRQPDDDPAIVESWI